MTFDEAMEKSRSLEAEAWLAILQKASPEKRRAALLAHINFNPFMFLFEDVNEHSNSTN